MQPLRKYFKTNGVRYGYLIWDGNAQGPEPSQAGPSEAAPAPSCSAGTLPEAPQRAGLPPVLLIHGFAQSAQTWHGVAQLLAEDRTVYALDLVGHGQSAKPANESAYSLIEMGKALLAFAKSLPAPPLLVGYSLGGRVALSALVESGPEAFARCVSGLVLESAGLGMPCEQAREEAAGRDAATVRRLRECSLAEFMTNWESLPLFASQKRLPRQVQEAVRAGRLANDPVALSHVVAQAGQHTMPARSDILAALRRLAALQPPQPPAPARPVAPANPAAPVAGPAPAAPAPQPAAPARPVALAPRPPASAGPAPAAPALANPFPILYIAGQLDGKYAAMAAELAHATSSAVHVRFAPNVGHNVHLEAPEIFADCVRCVI